MGLGMPSPMARATISKTIRPPMTRAAQRSSKNNNRDVCMSVVLNRGVRCGPLLLDFHFEVGHMLRQRDVLHRGAERIVAPAVGSFHKEQDKTFAGQFLWSGAFHGGKITINQ